MSTHGFPKAEHIVLQRDILALFAAGTSSTAAFPLRAVWHTTEWDEHSPRVMVMVSVAKRRLRHAVDRNRAKRQIREAYRLEKAIVCDEAPIPEGQSLHIAFIWTADAPQQSALVRKKMHTLLQRISEKLHEKS